MKTKMIAVLTVFLLAFGGMGFAADELPVEIDIVLLAETMTLEDAKKTLKQEIEESEMKAKDGQKAVEVLGILVEKGLPVAKAYETVSGAVEKGQTAEEFLNEEKIAGLAREAAKEGIEAKAEENNAGARDVAVAVEVLDGLVEEGIPVEKARSVVERAIGEDRNPQEMREMLTSEYVEQARKDYEKEKADKRAAGESFRDRIRSFIDEGIGKIRELF